MPTYPQLGAEVWFGREFQPPTLEALCEQLREFFGVGAIAIGSKGDNNHVYGYHRSRAWILNSKYCTNRNYSVSETEGNRIGGNPNWLCAIDMTLPADQLIPMCQRLDAAVRSGQLEKVTEWYGNDDGDNRVDGYNNIADVVASSDASHLWHAHISLDRGRAGEDHSDLFAILTGQTPVEDDMQQYFFAHDPEDDTYWLCDGMFARGPLVRPPDGDEMADIKFLANELGMFKLWQKDGVDIWPNMPPAVGLRIPWTGSVGGPVSGPVDLTPAALKQVEDAAFRASQRAEDA
jgi:hypothetical protein